MAGRPNLDIRAWPPAKRRGAVGVVVVLMLLLLAVGLRDDVLKAALDPQTPFQTYAPPPGYDYAKRQSWALFLAEGGTTGFDVFFVHPTTYNGGGDWNAPPNSRRANRILNDVMLPNYAAPFARAGRLYAPRYRQASLFAVLTGREDAREARAFAYDDVRAAFRMWAARYNGGRPFILAGVEQGGSIVDRLLAEEVAPDPALRERLVAAYVIGTVSPEGGPVPPCARRGEAGCLVAYASVEAGDERSVRKLKQRALVWNGRGELEALGGRAPVCVNPLLGAARGDLAPAPLNLGAANASKLEWGLRPAFLPRQVSAQCIDGVLHVSVPASPSLKRARGWTERLKAPRYNPFWADLEADALARVTAWKRGKSPIPLEGGEAGSGGGGSSEETSR